MTDFLRRPHSRWILAIGMALALGCGGDESDGGAGGGGGMGGGTTPDEGVTKAGPMQAHLVPISVMSGQLSAIVPVNSPVTRRGSVSKCPRVNGILSASRAASVSTVHAPMGVLTMQPVSMQIRLCPSVSMAAAVNARPTTSVLGPVRVMSSSTCALNRLFAATAANVLALVFASVGHAKRRRTVGTTRWIARPVRFARRMGSVCETRLVHVSQTPIALCSDTFVSKHGRATFAVRARKIPIARRAWNAEFAQMATRAPNRTPAQAMKNALGHGSA